MLAMHARYVVLGVLLTAAAGRVPGWGAAPDALPVRLVPQLLWEEQTKDRPAAPLLSPDGRYAAAFVGGEVRVLDRTVNRMAWVMPGAFCGSMAFSPDSRVLAALRPDWPPADGPVGMLLFLEKDARVDIQDARPGPLAFAPDGRQVMIAHGTDVFFRDPAAVQLVDLAGKVVRTIGGTLQRPERLEVSADGKQVTLWGQHGGVHTRKGGYPAKAIVQLDTGNVTVERIPREVARDGTASPSLRGLEYLSGYACALHWDAACAKAVLLTSRPGNRYRLFGWDLRELGMRQVPDIMGGVGHWLGPNRFFAVRYSNTLPTYTPTILDLDTGRQHDMPGLEARGVPSPDARHWISFGNRASGETEEVVRLFTIADTPKELWRLKWQGTMVMAAGWAKLDGRWVVLIHRHVHGGTRRLIEIHALEDGRLLKTLLDGRRDIYSFAVGPNHDRLILGFGDMHAGSAALVDLASGKELGSVAGFDIWINAAVFLDADRAVIASQHGQVALWDLTAGRIAWRCEAGRDGLPADIDHFHYLPGSRYLAAHEHHGQCRVIEVASGHVARWISGWGCQPLRGQPSWSTSPLVGDGSRCLETSGGSPGFRLAETATGRTLATFTGFDDGTWLAYTPDGFWTGSDKARDRLAAFRGDTLLPDAELQSRCQPDRVRAILGGL